MKLGNIQKSILISSIVCFILSTFVVYVILYKSSKQIEWPPQTPDCPDWWKSVGDGNNKKCINIKQLGTCKQKEMSFNNAIFQGTQGNCSKYTWATNCNLSWDGITYGITNPCKSN